MKNLISFTIFLVSFSLQGQGQTFTLEAVKDTSIQVKHGGLARNSYIKLSLKEYKSPESTEKSVKIKSGDDFIFLSYDSIGSFIEKVNLAKSVKDSSLLWTTFHVDCKCWVTKPENDNSTVYVHGGAFAGSYFYLALSWKEIDTIISWLKRL